MNKILEGLYSDYSGSHICEVVDILPTKPLIGIRVGSTQYELALSTRESVLNAIKTKRMIYIGPINEELSHEA